MRSTAVAEIQAYCHQALWSGPFQPTANADAGPSTAVLCLRVPGRWVLSGAAGSVGALAPGSPRPRTGLETWPLLEVVPQCPRVGASSPLGSPFKPSPLSLKLVRLSRPGPGTAGVFSPADPLGVSLIVLTRNGR